MIYLKIHMRGTKYDHNDKHTVFKILLSHCCYLLNFMRQIFMTEGTFS